METRKLGNGLQTVLEHSGFLLVALVAMVASQIPMGCFVVASFALMAVGGGLIGFAKFPVYRSGHLFTFGFKSVPLTLMSYYRWGWLVFLVGVALGIAPIPVKGSLFISTLAIL